MNNNEKTRTGQGAGSMKSSTGVADQSNDSTLIKVVCIRTTDKGVLLKSDKSGDELWFSKKLVKIVTGEFAEGVVLTVNIEPWVIDRARQQRREKQEIRFTDQVRVVGYAKHQTALAYMVVCDADGATRPLAKSKVISIKTEFVIGKPVELIVPAWMLKRQDNSFPSWVQGARL